MRHCFIVSAGNQSRFNSDTPKALVDIGGVTILESNLRVLLKHVDNVTIVSSKANKQWFDSYSNDRVSVLPIESGKGCGDAVWQVLCSSRFDCDDYCFIMWGDTLISENIVEECIKSKFECVVPVVKEDMPYVQVVVDEDMSVEKVRFSKYKEDVDRNSFHDLSIFYGRAKIFKEALDRLRESILVDGRYVCEHGNEMTFLDIFNYGKVKEARAIEIENAKSLSFNTIEEYYEIKNKYGRII